MPQLDPSELRRGLEHPLTVRRLADPEINVALALIRCSGLRREEGEWVVGPDGRRTAAMPRQPFGRSYDRSGEG
jgi:hypothetical protein